MKYSLLLLLPAMLSGSVVWAASAPRDAKAPTACAVVTEKEASALVGGPLGEVFKSEEKPTTENAYDHMSVCGFFTKGYNIQKADHPPERGLMIQFHAMRSNADARQFYENQLTVTQDMAKTPNSPFAGVRIVPLSGMGESAFLQARKLDPAATALDNIAVVTFLKGRVMGQVTVWKKAAPVDEIAQSAAKRVLSMLP